ncbi:hypothetical protein LM7416_20003 [Listeria monocytogenes]|nr:hypothetical protein LM7414_20003 [Listeria monocytogenes]CUL25593.1 hypothetical protein LM7416_20003 [Listeria monocytogenes]
MGGGVPGKLTWMFFIFWIESNFYVSVAFFFFCLLLPYSK